MSNTSRPAVQVESSTLTHQQSTRTGMQGIQEIQEIEQKYGITYRPPEWDKLLIACQKNNAHLVALFLTPKELGGEGISANHANAVDQSALHVACWWGHVDCVAILLKYGANVHARNKITSATPLHATCQSNRALGKRVQVVDLLIKAGADLEARDHFDKLPVDFVLDSDADSEQLRVLLTSTAKLSANAFYYQLPQIEHEILEHIKKQRDVKELENQLAELASALKARANEQQDMGVLSNKQSPLKEVLEKWMECEEPHTFHLQALETLVKYEYTFDDKACRLYLEPQGPIDILVGQLCKAIVDRYRSTGKNLQDALLQEWIQGVTLLRPYVTDPSAASQLWLEMSRRNYLQLAKTVWWGTWKLDPNLVVGPQDMTPIHFAARSGNLEFAKLLVEIQTTFSSNPKSVYHLLSQQTKLGQTPLQAAKVNGKQDIVEWFESLQTPS